MPSTAKKPAKEEAILPGAMAVQNKYIGTMSDDDDNRLDLRAHAPPPSPRAASCQPSPFPFFVFWPFLSWQAEGGEAISTSTLHLAFYPSADGDAGRPPLKRSPPKIAASPNRGTFSSGYFLFGVLSLSLWVLSPSSSPPPSPTPFLHPTSPPLPLPIGRRGQATATTTTFRPPSCGSFSKSISSSNLGAEPLPNFLEARVAR